MGKNIDEILNKLHSPEGLPRLEIEGCSYPVNQDLVENYKRSIASKPERRGNLVIVHLDAEKGQNWGWWLKHDGFGGQIGSINVRSEYLDHLDAPEGDKCAYVLKEKFDRRDYYYTEIHNEYLLFRKSDLVKAVESALREKTCLKHIQGKRIVDDVIWDDSIPTGPGLKVTDVDISLQINLAGENPEYKITFL